MTSAPRRGWLLALLLLLATGCGAQDQQAPLTPPPARRCPSLDQSLPQTLEAAQSGQLQPLADALARFTDSQPGDTVGELLQLALDLLRALLPQAQGLDSSLSLALPQGLGASLGGALRGFLPEDPQQRADRLLLFQAADHWVHQCPQGTFTDPLLALLEDQALIQALVATLREPEVFALLAPLLTPEAGEVGRSSMETLLRLVVDELLKEEFDAQGLARAARPFLPVQEPPLSDLITELDRALQGSSLLQVQALLRCVEQPQLARSDGQTRDGVALLGAALYDAIAAPGFQGAPVVAALPEGDSGSGLLGLARAALLLWRDQPALRQRLEPLIAFALDTEHTAPTLEGLAALLEAGALEELTGWLGQLSGQGCQIRDTESP